MEKITAPVCKCVVCMVSRICLIFYSNPIKESMLISDMFGYTALILAANNSKFRICKLLIQKGANLDCVNEVSFYYLFIYLLTFSIN